MKPACVALCIAVLALAPRVASAVDPAGDYLVEGEDQRGPYTGRLALTKSDDGYAATADVRYESGAHVTRKGHGSLDGHALSIAYDVSETTGLAGAVGGKHGAKETLDAVYRIADLELFRGKLTKKSKHVGDETVRRPAEGLVLVFTNRQWEAEAFVAATLDKDLLPSSIDPKKVVDLGAPDLKDGATRPRLRLRIQGFDVEVWCLEDLTRSDPDLDVDHLSQAKWRLMRTAFAEGTSKKLRKPDLVLGCCSGAVPAGGATNGSVVIGDRLFIHDPGAAHSSKADPWAEELDRVFASPSLDGLWDAVAKVREAAEKKLRAPPVTSGKPKLRSGERYVSVGTINVPHSADYDWADPQTIQAFDKKKADDAKLASIDTVQGLMALRVRDLSPATPFVFVSGVLNHVGKFDEEVIAKDPHEQCAVTMKNAAVATLSVLPELIEGSKKHSH
jgi:hypothetical protein